MHSVNISEQRPQKKNKEIKKNNETFEQRERETPTQEKDSLAG